MKVTAQFFYGIGYASPSGTDVEHFFSLSDVLDTLYFRYHDKIHFPCVEECEAQIFVGHINDVSDVYPDYNAFFGPRGAVRVKKVF